MFKQTIQDISSDIVNVNFCFNIACKARSEVCSDYITAGYFTVSLFFAIKAFLNPFSKDLKCSRVFINIEKFENLNVWKIFCYTRIKIKDPEEAVRYLIWGSSLVIYTP